MRILVDMDDVLEVLSEHWIEVLNKKFDTSFTREDMTDWNIENLFNGATKKDVLSALIEDGFWKDVKPMPGGQEAIQEMIDNGYEVYVVTNSAYQTIKEKMEEVLFKYYPMLTWDNVIITKNKTIVSGDVLIDDGVHNLMGGVYEKVLFDAPWNRDFDEERFGIKRVYDWREALDYIYTLDRRPPRVVGVKSRR